MRRLSIFGTLVLLFTVAGFVIIGGVSLYLLHTFEQYQWLEKRGALLSRLQETVTELDSVTDARELITEELREIRDSIEKENARRPRSKFSIAIVDGATPLLIIGPMPPERSFPSPAPGIDAATVTRAEGADGRHYLATSVSAQAGPARLLIRLALDETGDEESLEAFRERTLTALFFGAALLALAGAFVARRATQPIVEIADAARRLEVGRVDEGFQSLTWPAELQVLAVEFSSMQRRLADSFSRLSQFSADIAHELRTPVNNLLGEAEVALSRPRAIEEYRATLESMLEEVQRLRRMIDELLFLARAERPETQVEATTLDARHEAEAVAEFLAPLGEEKSVSISIEGDASICADRQLLRRALGNLIANAIEYCHEGGSVVIRLMETGAGSAISVADDGPGIAPAHQPHIFDRFYRVDEARSQHPEGTGLGLAIVRSITALHGGSASVSSSPDQGSTFTLFFPRAR